MPEPMPMPMPTTEPILVPGPTLLPRALWTDGGQNGDPKAILWTQGVDRGLPVGLWYVQPEGAVTGTGGGDHINAHVS